MGVQAVPYQIARVWGSQSCDVRLDMCKEPPTCQPEAHLRTPLYLTGLEFGTVDFGVQLELIGLPIPIIHHIHKISIWEGINVGINKVYSLIHLMAVAQTVQLCIVRVDQSCWFAVKFLGRTPDYIGELGPDHGGWCEIKDEASVIANSTFMRKDIRVNAFNTRRGKNCVDRYSTVSKGWGYVQTGVHCKHCLDNNMSGSDNRLAMHP